MIKVFSYMCCFLLFSCSASNVKYQSPTKLEAVTTEFGSSDLQSTASKMVHSLLNFAPMQTILAKKRPIVFVDRIKNKTMEHLDLESLTDTVRKDLIQSGKFRFVDMTAVDQVFEQLDYQSDSGLVNPATAKTVGNQLGAEYMLYGALSSIEKRSGRIKDVYYKLTLNLMDIELGIIEWSEEKEIRKVSKRKLVGR